MRAALGDRQSWRRRLKQFVGLHLRQLPCLHAVVERARCFRGSYQNLGQDEGDEGRIVQDQRQHVNEAFAQVMIKTALVLMLGITLLMVARGSNFKDRDMELSAEEYDAQEFKHDAPVVLYLAAVELLVSGACAHTAASMYKRRRHALKHPADNTGAALQSYMKVHLEKDIGLEDRQLYGLGFRPSSDGLECLFVEAVRQGSLLDRWNARPVGPSPEELLEEALGDGAAQSSPSQPRRHFQQVHPGAAIVAVNEVSADVGMMQVQLTKPKVTLWVLSGMTHPSQLEEEVLPGAQVPPAGPQPCASEGHVEGDLSAVADAGSPAPTFIGQVESDRLDMTSRPRAGALSGARCACLAFEDEDPQILTRWTVCAIMFGWITMLPVLLMQPHEERPRQQLFRQYLLKPCLLVLPFWSLLWLLDCLQLVIQRELVHPFYFFSICHMILPGILVWYLLQMQVADEKMVLDQRKSRVVEAGCSVPVVIEDPSPTFLKELITLNPVALVWLGTCASLPLVAASCLTPMTTERGKLAQGFVHIIFGPLIALQLGFALILFRTRFIDLPKLYFAGFGFLLTVPCFLVWCFCMLCASRYGRQDLALVQRQRLQRGKEALQGTPWTAAVDPAASAALSSASASSDIVDLSEAQNREWELIFAA